LEVARRFEHRKGATKIWKPFEKQQNFIHFHGQKKKRQNAYFQATKKKLQTKFQIKIAHP